MYPGFEEDEPSLDRAWEPCASTQGEASWEETGQERYRENKLHTNTVLDNRRFSLKNSSGGDGGGRTPIQAEDFMHPGFEEEDPSLGRAREPFDSSQGEARWEEIEQER